MACALGIEQDCKECGLCGNSPTWRCKMAKCKYPNEVCANITVYNCVAYCDSVPCSLKDELPKRTNADMLRGMNNKDLAKLLCEKFRHGVGEDLIKELLESECDAEC